MYFRIPRRSQIPCRRKAQYGRSEPAPHTCGRRVGLLWSWPRGWPVAIGKQTLVACAVWVPDKTLTKTCADFSDLEIGPDGWLYLLSDKSATIARIDDLAPGGGTASLTNAWRFRDLGGKPEGLAFTAGGGAVVALDKRKPRRNLVLLEPAIAASKGRSQGQKTKPVSRRVARKRAMPVTKIKHGRK